jgi:hypothetical protein
MEPRRIPLGSDTFEPGEDIQSVLQCDGQRPETVSLSNFVPTLELYFLQGAQFNLVEYSSSAPTVAAIRDDGLVTADAPGSTDIGAVIWKFQASKAGLCAAAQVTGIPNVTVTCPSGTQNCNGKCVDTQTDPANCGACGAACGGGQICSAGQCSCGPGTELCGGHCASDICLGNQTFDQSTCSCQCPAGSTWNPSTGECESPTLCPTGIRIAAVICQCFVNNPWGSSPNTYITVQGVADIEWTNPDSCTPALSFGASMLMPDGSEWTGGGQLFAAYYSDPGPFAVGQQIGVPGVCGDVASVAGQSVACERTRYDCQGFVCTPVPD